MTTSTQAQIEAANFRSLLGRCLKVAMSGHWRDKANLSIEAHPVWDDVRAALTAAAEVGVPAAEVGEKKQWPKEFWDEFLRLRKQGEVNATIERCAQVAEGFSQRTKSSAWEWAAQEIAAAIRALKAQP